MAQQGKRMNVVMLSKALVVGAYQKKAEELARLRDVRLTVLVPPYWLLAGHRQQLERAYTAGYELRVIPMAWNGHFHWHYYPDLRRQLRELRPDVVHVDEEPYNLATAHAIWCARRADARTVFFTWQNIHRRMPPPFNVVERYCLHSADTAIAGNQEAVAVLRRKGYRGSVAVIPQFGIDPALFRPRPAGGPRGPLTIGYLGRLVEEKGLAMLCDAVAGLGGDYRLLLVGDGPLRGQLMAQASQLGQAVEFRPTVRSTAVPEVLAELDMLVLPSLTRPNWKEQFGRVLVEAMACGIAVIGSDCGEIPNVIGAAGIVFPEGDVGALRAALRRLRDDADWRRELGAAGRARALACFSQASVAERTHRVYRELVRDARRA